MNFKPTKWKVIISVVIGFVLGFLVSIRTFFGLGLQISLLIIVWIVILLIIYIIWSLIEKPKEVKKKIGVAWLEGGLIGAGTVALLVASYWSFMRIGIIEDSGLFSNILRFLGMPTYWLFKFAYLELSIFLVLTVGSILMGFVYGALSGWVTSKIKKANWIKGVIFGAVFSLFSLLILGVISREGLKILMNVLDTSIIVFIIFTIVPTIIFYLIDWKANKLKSREITPKTSLREVKQV